MALPGVPVVISPASTRTAWRQAAEVKISDLDRRTAVLETLDQFLHLNAAALPNGTAATMREALSSALEGLCTEIADQADFVAFLKQEWQPKLGTIPLFCWPQINSQKPRTILAKAAPGPILRSHLLSCTRGCYQISDT